MDELHEVFGDWGRLNKFVFVVKQFLNFNLILIQVKKTFRFWYFINLISNSM